MSDILAQANVFGLVWDPGQDPLVDEPVGIIPGSNIVVNEGLDWIIASLFRDQAGITAPPEQTLWAYLDRSAVAPAAGQNGPLSPPGTNIHKGISGNATVDGRTVTFTSAQWSVAELRAIGEAIQSVGLVATAGNTAPDFSAGNKNFKAINRTLFNFPATPAVNQTLSILFRFTFRSI